jgi:hypothetical protein
MELSTTCHFRKDRVKPLGSRKYGRYRGNGKLILTDIGFTIEGEHILSLGKRWAIGIFLGAIASVFYSLLGGIVLGYFLAELVFLKRQSITVTWDNLLRYAFDTKEHLIALDFVGPDWTSPSVAHLFFGFDRVARALRELAPDKDATPDVLLL